MQLSAGLLLLAQSLGLALPFAVRPPLPPRRIESCTSRVDVDGGSWLLGGRLESAFAWPPYCSLKVRAPIGSRVRFSLRLPANFTCSRNQIIMALNGWQVVDRLRRLSQFLPSSRAQEERRRLVCASVELTSDDNIAELLYSLPSGQGPLPLISVAFEEDPARGCNSVVEPLEMGRELRMHVTAGGRCRWLLPGSIKLHFIKDSFREGHSCSESRSSLRVLGGHDLDRLRVWDSFCVSSPDLRVAGPCQYTVLELSSERAGGEEITFTFGPIDFSEKLLGEMDCL